MRGLQQQRHDVVALGQVGGAAALGDLRVDRAVDALQFAPEGRDPRDPVGSQHEHRDALDGVGDVSSSPRSSRRNSSMRGPSETPNTARSTISSVIACIRGRSG